MVQPLNDKLYVVEDQFDLLFEEFIRCGSPFTILLCQLVVVVGILEDHDLLRCHKLLAPIHLRICSILPRAVQLGVRTPVLATTSRDCAGPTGVRCAKAAIRAPAVVVLLHALDDAGAFILLLGRLLLRMPTILMPTILMPIILLLLMPAGLVLLLSPFRAPPRFL